MYCIAHCICSLQHRGVRTTEQVFSAFWAEGGGVATHPDRNSSGEAAEDGGELMGA